MKSCLSGCLGSPLILLSCFLGSLVCLLCLLCHFCSLHLGCCCCLLDLGLLMQGDEKELLPILLLPWSECHLLRQNNVLLILTNLVIVGAWRIGWVRVWIRVRIVRVRLGIEVRGPMRLVIRRFPGGNTVRGGIVLHSRGMGWTSGRWCNTGMWSPRQCHRRWIPPPCPRY